MLFVDIVDIKNKRIFGTAKVKDIKKYGIIRASLKDGVIIQ